jgi:opacity protein-like surface antigen
MKLKLITKIAILTTVSALASPRALAAEHEKTFGVKTGYISRNQSGIAGLFFQYSFTEHFRLAPELGIAFKNNSRDALLIDINAHVPMATSGVAEFYPYAGLNYSSWSQHQTFADEVQSKDVTKRTSRLGVNVGGGMGLNLSSTLKVKLEVGYSAVVSNSAFRATVGIGYIF